MSKYREEQAKSIVIIGGLIAAVIGLLALIDWVFQLHWFDR